LIFESFGWISGFRDSFRDMFWCFVGAQSVDRSYLTVDTIRHLQYPFSLSFAFFRFADVASAFALVYSFLPILRPYDVLVFLVFGESLKLDLRGGLGLRDRSMPAHWVGSQGAG